MRNFLAGLTRKNSLKLFVGDTTLLPLYGLSEVLVDSWPCPVIDVHEDEAPFVRLGRPLSVL